MNVLCRVLAALNEEDVHQMFSGQVTTRSQCYWFWCWLACWICREIQYQNWFRLNNRVCILAISINCQIHRTWWLKWTHSTFSEFGLETKYYDRCKHFSRNVLSSPLMTHSSGQSCFREMSSHTYSHFIFILTWVEMKDCVLKLVSPLRYDKSFPV